MLRLEILRLTNLLTKVSSSFEPSIEITVQNMSLLGLPNELLFPVAKELAPHDLRALVLTNRRLAVVLTSALHDSAAKDKKHAVAALFWAAAIGREAMVRLILEKGPRLVIEDTTTHGNNHTTSICKVLHDGPAECSDEVVKKVLEKGANLVIRDNFKRRTGLNWAIENKRKTLLKLLLENGANTEARINDNEQTVLHLAAEGGDEAAARLLLHKGAHLRIQKDVMQPLPWEIKNLCADVSSVDCHGYMPLHLTARAGHVKLVELLLDSDANINAQNSVTPLYLAAKHDKESVVALLLKRGADPNLKNDSGMTALHLAVLYRFGSVVELLLEYGADVSIRDRHGVTVLHVAAENGDEILTKALLKKDADINARNDYGITPLHLSAKYGHVSVVEILLNEGADIAAENSDGHTALYLAARRNYSSSHRAAAELLLKRHGAEDKSKFYGFRGLGFEHASGGIEIERGHIYAPDVPRPFTSAVQGGGRWAGGI